MEQHPNKDANCFEIDKKNFGICDFQKVWKSQVPLEFHGRIQVRGILKGFSGSEY